MKILSPYFLCLLVIIIQNVYADGTCYSSNSGSTGSYFSIYQTHMTCSTTCSGYAYAIVQGNNCWCSNNKPDEASQLSDAACNYQCPGYNNEACGSKTLNAFTYIQLKDVGVQETTVWGDVTKSSYDIQTSSEAESTTDISSWVSSAITSASQGYDSDTLTTSLSQQETSTESEKSTSETQIPPHLSTKNQLSTTNTRSSAQSTAETNVYQSSKTGDQVDWSQINWSTYDWSSIFESDEEFTSTSTNSPFSHVFPSTISISVTTTHSMKYAKTSTGTTDYSIKSSPSVSDGTSAQKTTSRTVTLPSSLLLTTSVDQYSSIDEIASSQLEDSMSTILVLPSSTYINELSSSTKKLIINEDIITFTSSFLSLPSNIATTSVLLSSSDTSTDENVLRESSSIATKESTLSSTYTSTSSSTTSSFVSKDFASSSSFSTRSSISSSSKSSKSLGSSIVKLHSHSVSKKLSSTAFISSSTNFKSSSTSSSTSSSSSTSKTTSSVSFSDQQKKLTSSLSSISSKTQQLSTITLLSTAVIESIITDDNNPLHVRTVSVTTVYTIPTAIIPQNNNVNANNSNGKNSFWQSPGKITGTFVVVGIVVCAIIVVAIYLFLRPKNSQADPEKHLSTLKVPSGPFNHYAVDPFMTPINRHSYQFSSSSSSPVAPMTEKHRQSSNIRSPSQAYFADENSDSTRYSQMLWDQRLDPHQVLNHLEFDNSNASFADDVDYSRKVIRILDEN
ncbi:hypothetical protein TBLA_0E01430 [Henningerozyma blattae CBS 6284]|uniref:WSC domain-containing protein n=1 Tax=Henningerozyma blattae (strain ATCC 34711 / CBS 6284 / DSM 70876 / NBRC 10599 / NRRL Y-10934 / UCD 77-7) TaxID=1071380 RepID=I2H4A0_HENB6|nr:hypothetical protein TBLA_0E01430 [Tetrapisispora blattae CBS 6284]CCH61202.1 hypothetical protein TBLA_0E01430 [Tetrapisispora blattae CBS 6284]